MLFGLMLLALGVGGALVTYLGFPLFLWLTTLGRRPATPGEGRLPALRLVIPSYNEEALIVAKVRNVLEQDYPADLLEVVVVDDGSTDRTCERVREEFGSRVRVLALGENGGKNAALNVAMERLKPHPPLVGTTDADAMLTPGVLRRLATALSDDSVGLAAARLVYRPSSGEFREQQYFGYESWVRVLESRDACCVSIPGQLELHRANLWQPLPRTVATDMGTALAVLSQGYGVVTVGDAVVHSSTTPSAMKELGRKARTVRRGLRAATWKWHELDRKAAARIIGHKVLRYLSPAYQALVLAGCGVLALQGSVLGLLALGAQLAVYAAVALGWGFARGGSRSAPARLLTHLFYLQAVYLTAFGELVRWLAGDDSVPEWSRARLEEGATPALSTER